MKTSSVSAKIFKPAQVLFFALLLITTYTNAQLKFKNLVLESGTDKAAGAVYRAKSVYTNIDALVRIDSLVNGSTILDIDQTGGIGYDDALQPQIKSGGQGTSYAVITISFVLANTNIPTVIASLTATNLDLDGNSNLKEFCEFDMTGGLAAFMSNNPQISVTAKGNKYYGINVAGQEYNGIDTSADAVMFKVRKNVTSGFTVRLGTVTTNGTNAARQYSVYMKDFYISNATLLPLTLLNFDAVLKSEKVNLSWTTTEHKDFSHFVLQRSTDGKNFKDVMTLMTEEVSYSSVNQYSYKDDVAGVNATVVYYRLQLNDLDGKQQYSPVRLVRLNAANKVQIQAFPNPVTSELRIMIPTNWQERTTVYEIYNNNGMLVNRTQVAKAAQVQQLNVQTLGAGNYIIRVTSGVEVSTSKFVKY